MGLSDQLRDMALRYAEMGWAVFRLKAGGKEPATAHGYQDATTDPRTIRAWWADGQPYNIGVATGSMSGGLMVIDLDEKKEKHGVRVLHDWEKEHGALPGQTVTSRTATGGEHRYYRADRPGGCKADLYPGVDIRADGGYVVAPPSVVNGGEYRWIASPERMPVLDADSQVWAFRFPLSEQENKTPYRVPESIEEGSRTAVLVRLIGSLRAKGLGNEAIRAAVVAENESRCNPPLTDYELEREVFPALSRSWRVTAPYTQDAETEVEVSALVKRLQEIQAAHSQRYGLNDAGSGNLFADLTQDVLCYVPDRKKWFYFDGQRWRPDCGGEAMRWAKRIATALMIYAAGFMTEADEDFRTRYIKFCARWQQLKFRETVLKDAATVAPVSYAEFDSNPWLFNCQNGTLNLRTGDFAEHDSRQRITKLSGVNYVPGATCERWERFMGEIFCGDAELVRYMQKALGYALAGDTRHECFFILYGATARNGKGTLCETFAHLVGDYGRSANPETLAQRKFTDSRSPSEDVARLAGARFVNLSEPDKRMVFNAALVKSMTGGDTVTARFLGENSFQFRPQFKMFVGTNHLPAVTDTSLFTSDRVRVIPFNRHFSETERDMTLKQTLSSPENLSGILNWCMRGLQMLEAEGFTIPAAVKRATRDYAEMSDKVGNFISEALIYSPGEKTDARMVFSRYQDWCYANGFKAEGFSEFRKSLASAGIEVKRMTPKGGDRNSTKINGIADYMLCDSA